MNPLFLLLADWTVKATLVIALASFLMCFRKGRTKLRRMVWVAAPIGILFIPIVGALRPASSALVRIPGPVIPIAAQIPAKAGISDAWPLAIWLVGLVVTAVSFGVGYVGLWRAIRRSRTYSNNLQGFPTPGFRRGWTLRVSDTGSIHSAITFGVFRPVVLLPADAQTWTEEQMRSVLLHELGHIRSLDSLVQLLANAECAFFWFNPAVWLVAKALRTECEANADEAVMDAGVKASDYASMLLGFAARGNGRQAHRVAHSFVRKPRIESRIRTIVQRPAQTSRPLTALSRVAATAISSLLILATGTVRLAEAQNSTTRPEHNADWQRGFELGRAYKASKLGFVRDPKRDVESMREKEIRARHTKQPPP